MAPISVLVVDDSVVVRRLVTSALEDDADIVVAGTASNGRLALARLEQSLPDVVTLDIEMPELDGLATMKEIHRRWPRLPVIMFSTLTGPGAMATFDALSFGAADYVTKPANVGSVTESLASVREQLIPKIKALGAGSRRRSGGTGLGSSAASPPFSPPAPQAAVPVPRRAPSAVSGSIDILAIGCSTGGPEALTGVLRDLPGTLPVPVVVVQHMPKVFTALFAERLNGCTPFTVHEATAGLVLQPGHVYIAPGDFHLELTSAAGGVVTRLHQGPAENYCRPAVDPLFRSVAAMYGGKVLAVVLTGMGSDGKQGAGVLKAAGAHVVVQDEATSVVWGMPGAVTNAGFADVVLPLSDIAPYIASALSPARRLTPGAAIATEQPR